MRIHVSSLGCKLNQSEIDSLAAQLAAAGHHLVDSPADAEVCILNTCAVTHVAAQKSRQALRRLHRDNPGAALIATGCYAELEPDTLRTLPGVQLVAGNHDKERLPNLLSPCSGGFSRPLPPPTHRARAFVKIQDGCNNACTYCIIHVARGPERSRPPAEIVAGVRAQVAAGHQEVVLTGVNLGAYGHDGLDLDLWGLVARLLAETRVSRLRLSSIEPWDLSPGALALWSDPRLCPHLHLPLQSGCDATLRRMARPYRTSDYQTLIAAAHSAIPDLAVTTDVIAGFPGETGAEFAASLAFIESMAFARVHVFPYSPRSGTPAAVMPGQVPAAIKNERGASLRAVAAESQRAFSRQFVGRIMDVLWESAPYENERDRLWSGLTGNYLRVRTRHANDLANTLAPTRLLALTKGGLWGEVEA